MSKRVPDVVADQLRRDIYTYAAEVLGRDGCSTDVAATATLAACQMACIAWIDDVEPPRDHYAAGPGERPTP